MSLISINKKELVELEDLLKEKDKRIKKLETDNFVLVGLNHKASILLTRSMRDSGKTVRDLWKLMHAPLGDTRYRC